MKLVSFSVENYRSITTARKIPLSNYSLLVGANNEGKSNILHALTLGMKALTDWQRQFQRTRDTKSVRPRFTPTMRRRGQVQYDWDTDYPISKQKRAKSTSTTNITLEFELNSQETTEFKSEIGSNLNGTLPLLMSFGQGTFDVLVKKPGKGQVTLTKKSARIADFVSKRIRFEYIPAIRTAESASRVIGQLVERELFTLEDDPEYSAAVARIEELQQPVFDELAETIQTTVAGFLPNVKSVELKSYREARFRSLRRDVEIIVDDGTLTKLERKGDGVQSLVALALMRHASEQSAQEGKTIIAIEEPESHLHPRAVHELRSVIEKLSEKNQVVLTSHSPLFVDPDNLSNTIIVKESKAAQAKRISAVREALGVRFSDNLENARLVLLVEGPSDVKALNAILRSRSHFFYEASKSGTITIDFTGGASGLIQKASYYKAGACQIQAFLDDDDAGRIAADRAITEKILTIRDINLSSVSRMKNAELEDLYDVNIYKSEFLANFGVDPSTRLRGSEKFKWSKKMEKIFKQAGKPWSEATRSEIKNWLANFAKNNCDKILKTELVQPIDNLIKAVIDRIPKS